MSRAPQYRRGRGPFFAQVPFALQEGRCWHDGPCEHGAVGAATIAVYAALQRFTDFGDETGASVKDDVAARMAHVSRREFIRRRHQLRQMGWIEWRSGRVSAKANEYLVHRSLAGPADQTEADGGVTAGHTSATDGGVTAGHTCVTGRHTSVPPGHTPIEEPYREPVTESQDRESTHTLHGAREIEMLEDVLGTTSRQALRQLLEGRADPASAIATVRDYGPAGVNATAGIEWATVGQALEDMVAADCPFSPANLDSFIRRLIRDARSRERDTAHESWSEQLERTRRDKAERAIAGAGGRS